MSEALKIILTAFFAVLIYVIGQIVQRIFIEPIQEQRRTLGRIVHAMTYLCNVSTMTDKGGFIVTEDTKTAHRTLRGLASDLRASTRLIPFYSLLALCRFVPSSKKITAISTCLIGWGNSLGEPDDNKWKQIKELERLLNVQVG